MRDTAKRPDGAISPTTPSRIPSAISAALAVVVTVVISIAIASVATVPPIALAEDTTSQAIAAEVGGVADDVTDDAIDKTADKATGKVKARSELEVGRGEDEKAGKSRPTEFGPVDAILIATIVAACTAAIKSMAKQGARACSGNCSRCEVGCSEGAGRDLSKDPVLLARLEEIKKQS